MPDVRYPVLVTVIIPTYNRQAYVCEAIDSVLAQTMDDFDLVVVDDGSGDDTGKVLAERYGDQIDYVWQENQGESVARNEGIARARGKYLAFLDDDDLWLPQKLARQVEYLEGHEDVALVGCQWQVLDGSGVLREGRPEVSRHREGTVLLGEVVRDSPFPPSTTVVRTALAREIGGFDPSIRYGEDWDFVLRIAAQHAVHYTAEIMAVLRGSGQRQSGYLQDSDKARRRFADHLKIVSRLQTVAGEYAREQSGALARTYAEMALHELAQGEWELAQSHLKMSASLDFGIWLNGQRLDSLVLGYAALIAGTCSEAEAIRYLSTLYMAQLPGPQRPLRRKARQILGEFYSSLAFKSSQEHRWSSVRHHTVSAVRKRPSVLGNVGLLSVFGASFLRAETMGDVGRSLAVKIWGTRVDK